MKFAQKYSVFYLYLQHIVTLIKKARKQEIEPFLKIEESFDVLSTKTMPWA
jgi:hypothetical protein